MTQDSITSTLELNKLVSATARLALLVSANQCSLSPLGQRALMKEARDRNLPLYQADIFQVPKLISLYGLNPNQISLLIFEQGQLVAKEVA